MARSNASAIRGTRIGSGPMGEEDHGHHAERIEVTYWDAYGNSVERSYAADVPAEEIPEIVDHPKSGLPAGRDKDNPPAPNKLAPYKTHLAYVKERRSDDEGAELLEDALQKLRDKRGQ